MKTRIFLAAIAPLTFLALAPNLASAADRANLDATIDSISADDIRRHVFALADDTFEGREAGSRGGRAAAGYLTAEFQRYGLKGAGTQGSYFQAFGNYRNILAILEGSDPTLKSEYVLVGAHYDHVGYGNQQNSFGPTGYIHNGADDNASGTSGLVELAEACTRLLPRPKRSIVFALWDAEEKGLLGSKHWVSRPTLPLNKLAFSLNIDMLGRMRGDRVEISGARSSYGLRQLVSRQNVASDLLIDFDWETKDNSDHWSFYERNIPFLMLHTGLHGDYHRPSDDAEKINIEGIRRCDQLLLGIVHALADQPARQTFRSTARREGPSQERLLERGLPPLRGRLGVTLEGAATAGDVVRVRSVVPYSPAATAGLLPGDEIATFAGQQIPSIDRFLEMVISAPTNVEATVRRGTEAEPEPLAIKLDGQPIRIGISWGVDAAEPTSVMLTRIIPASPAQRAGLQLFDRVYQVAGQDFANADQFQTILNAASGPVEFLVDRHGRMRHITVTPAFDPPPTAASAAND